MVSPPSKASPRYAAAATTLAADTAADGPLKDDTVRDYLSALERLIVEDQPAWSPRMRSRTPLRSAAKRHFVDPSLVVRDLRVYAQPTSRVLQFRDAGGLEVDAIDADSAGPPAMLGVITATGYAYQRPDGVAVIPIGALGP